jgi:hypothetical protein
VNSAYSAFGISLRSNVPLPGLTQVQNPPVAPVVNLHLGMSPSNDSDFFGQEVIWYTSAILNSDGEPALHIWKSSNNDFLRLAYCDGMQFWIDKNRTNVWAVWPDTSSLEDAAIYLFGPVLGILLRLRGEICLHASAVAIGGRVAVFAGDAGAGKSTTAAAFARKGHPVVSDDIIRLVEREGIFYVQPAFPHVSLWPESVEFLFGSSQALTRFSTAWEKRDLPLGQRGTRFEAHALPVGAIYILGDRTSDPAPYVAELSSQSALMGLVANSYGTRILDLEMRAREFEFLARLATAAPVRRLIPHSDPSRLDLLCRIVQEDFEFVAGRRPVPI